MKLREDKKITDNKLVLKRLKIIAVIFMVIFLGSIYVLSISKAFNLQKYTLTDNVKVEHNGKKVYEGNIANYKVKDVKSEDTYTMYMKIPDVNIVNASLKYDNINVAVDIYQDDELVYSIGKDVPKVGVVCHAFNKVDLNDIKPNQEIKMCIRVINGSGFGFLPAVYLMNTKDSDLEYFYDMLLYIIMGVYLFVIGILGILIASYNMNKDIINKRLVVLSATCIVCAIYFVSMYQVIPIFSDNYIMDAYLEYASTVGVLIMLNLYMFMVNPKGKKLLSLILTIVSGIFLVAVIAMQILRIRAFNDSMTLFLGICLATAINFFITYAKNLKNFINKRIIMIGTYIIVSLIFVYVTIYIFFNNLKEKVLISVPIAIMLVLTVEFMDLIYEVVKGLISKAEQQALLNMAYIDKSTGLYNRRGLNKYIKELTKNIYNIYVFDINGLKKVNDKYGHMAGDYLIKTFADEVKKVFGDDFCARIGGDEFVVICEENEKKDQYINVLEDNIVLVNDKSQKEYKLQYSVGCDKYKPKNNSIEEVIKKADIAMYKMKEHAKNNV